jgi:Fe-S cluster assembly ATPase SufC
MKNFFSKFAHVFDDEPTALANSHYSEIDDDDEPTALAYTDFHKPVPVIEGEDAERFIKNMEEAEKKARERAKRPKTKAELESELSIMKMMYEYEERELNNLKNKIKNLEKELHAKAEEK